MDNKKLTGLTDRDCGEFRFHKTNSLLLLLLLDAGTAQVGCCTTADGI